MVIVVGTVVVEAGKVLLVQEAKERVRGLWNFPAGHLDAGELLSAAATREAKEETGLDIKLGGLIGIFNQVDPDLLVVMFRGETIQQGEAMVNEIAFNKNEILDVRWVPLEEIAQYPMRLPERAMQTILSRLENGQTFSLELVTALSAADTKGRV